MDSTSYPAGSGAAQWSLGADGQRRSGGAGLWQKRLRKLQRRRGKKGGGIDLSLEPGAIVYSCD